MTKGNDYISDHLKSGWMLTNFMLNPVNFFLRELLQCYFYIIISHLSFRPKAAQVFFMKTVVLLHKKKIGQSHHCSSSDEV